MFKRKFYKIRPDFLKNPDTNRNLEIDIYNADLKLGIEFNGEQHYSFIERFHSGYGAFKKQQERDQLKKRLCKENGVHLIVVPYNCVDITQYIERRAPPLP